MKTIGRVRYAALTVTMSVGIIFVMWCGQQIKAAQDRPIRQNDGVLRQNNL